MSVYANKSKRYFGHLKTNHLHPLASICWPVCLPMSACTCVWLHVGVYVCSACAHAQNACIHGSAPVHMWCVCVDVCAWYKYIYINTYTYRHMSAYICACACVCRLACVRLCVCTNVVLWTFCATLRFAHFRIETRKLLAPLCSWPGSARSWLRTKVGIWATWKVQCVSMQDTKRIKKHL